MKYKIKGRCMELMLSPAQCQTATWSLCWGACNHVGDPNEKMARRLSTNIS